MTDDAPIRRLGPDDCADLVDLAARVGWMDEGRRFAFLLEVAAVYGRPAPGGTGLIGTVTLCRFPPSSAAVGMMLVDPAHGGRGHGRALMRHILDVAGDATVALYATAAGRPLYERVGFVALADNRSYCGRYAGQASGMTERATDADLPEIIALDRVANGCDRGAMLAAYARFAEELRVKRDDGAITGYAGRWRHSELCVIGPVVASGTDAAIALCADAAAPVSGDVRIEVADGRPELAAWAEATGLVHAATTSAMTLGGRPLPGDRSRWFLPLTLATG